MAKVIHYCFVCILFFGTWLPASALRAQTTLYHKKSIHTGPDSLRQQIKKYYAAGLRYKNGINTPIDYKKAFINFKQAAELGDQQSIYALGYLYYKGFYVQDYVKAASLFKIGAELGRANSAYFLGLMYLNGYGLQANADSGRYWLQKSAGQGYRQAIQELQMHHPENDDSARSLLATIEKTILPAETPLNEFIRVTPAVSDSSIIAGRYAGYIITYDWSGQHVISARKLHMDLARESAAVKGSWQEQDGQAAPLHASLNKGILIFTGSRYSRTDHYSAGRAIAYDLKSAALHLIRRQDSVFLTGNISMFSHERNERSKPTVIALVKTSGLTLNNNGGQPDTFSAREDADSLKNGTAGTSLRRFKVYPNPFTTYIHVTFELTGSSLVTLELYSSTGQLIYHKNPSGLTAGKYNINIPTTGTLPGQTYVLRLMYEGGLASTKLIRN